MAKISERLVQVIAKVFGKSLPLSWERFQKDLTPIMKKMVGRLYCSSSYSKGFWKSLPLSWARFQKDGGETFRSYGKILGKVAPFMTKIFGRFTPDIAKFVGRLTKLQGSLNVPAMREV